MYDYCNIDRLFYLLISGLMLVSSLTVASYTRTLRPPEDSGILFKATTN